MDILDNYELTERLNRFLALYESMVVRLDTQSKQIAALQRKVAGLEASELRHMQEEPAATEKRTS
jgi:hypothetical protein